MKIRKGTLKDIMNAGFVYGDAAVYGHGDGYGDGLGDDVLKDFGAAFKLRQLHFTHYNSALYIKYQYVLSGCEILD